MGEDGGWRKLWQIGVTPGLTGVWTLLGLALFAAGLWATARLEVALHPDWLSTNALLAGLEILAAIPVTFVAHEAVHGLFFRLFGGRPRFGAGMTHGLAYFYAACPGQRFPRNRFLAVGLAPLVVLDLVGIALMLAPASAFFGAALIVFNTGGAVGDLWAAGVLLQAPSWIRMEDVGPVMVAWAPPAHAGETTPAPRGLDLPAGRWVLPWVVATLAISVVGAVPLGVATRASGAVWLGPLFLASRHRLNLVGGLLVAGVLAAVVMLAAARVRVRMRR